jgi:hypothetical protein
MSTPKEQRKTAFDAFNKEAKYVLKDMRDTFPVLASGIGILLIALKVTKHMGGRRMTHRIFGELVLTPFRERFRARDTAFFYSDAFSVQGHDEFVSTLKPLWRDLDGSSREFVWRRMESLIAVHGAAADACQAS